MTVNPSPAGSATKAWRRRMPALAVVVSLVAAVVAAVTGVAKPVDAMGFISPGHWLYNTALGSVVHINGATAGVDANRRVPGNYGDHVQVVQDDASGYVVGTSKVTEFGKSDLEVVEETDPVAPEVPFTVEVNGGPYLVYQETGKIARFGDEALTLSVEGELGEPVATSDGTLWVPREETGQLCSLARDADELSCPVEVPQGDRGKLSIVGDRPVFVDTTSDMLHAIESDGLGEGRELGVDVPDEVNVASSDVGGRVAILDPAENDMHLVDAAGLDPDRQAKDVVPVELAEDGDFDGPLSTGDVVAVMDQKTRTLSTYDEYGEPGVSKKLDEKGEARLSRGEDNRIYVDGEKGDKVLVVDRDGKVTGVDVGAHRGEEGGEGDGDAPAPPDKDTRAAPRPQGPPPNETSVPRNPQPPDAEVPDPDQERQVTQPPPDPPDPPPLKATPPGAPPSVSAQGRDASARVTWGTPVDNRAPITQFTVSWAGGSRTVGGGRRDLVVGGLANGTTYAFTVSATNSAGTGPGARSNPVIPAVPVTPAGPPGGLTVDFDRGDRSATMNWTPPALNGGTLSHYVVGVTGMQPQNVNGNSATLSGIPGPAGELTFTVRAVTNSPRGQLTGAQASRVEPDPRPAVTVSRGSPSEDSCDPPDCAWMYIVMSGFEPNTGYHVIPRSSNPSYFNSGAELITDANGYKDSERFEYEGVGDQVWVEVQLNDVVIAESEKIVWEAG